MVSSNLLICNSAALLPHFIIYLYKTGLSAFTPTIRLFLYATVSEELATSDEQLKATKNSSLLALTYHYRYPLPEIEDDENGNKESNVQTQAANYIMAIKIIQNMIGLVIGFCGGSWSDRIGRRLPMMLPLIGGILASILLMLIELIGAWTVPAIFVGAAISALFGENNLLSMSIQAYITDRTSEDVRTFHIGRVNALGFFGYATGSIILAIVANRWTFWEIFICVVILYGIALGLVAIALPESTGSPQSDGASVGLLADEPDGVENNKETDENDSKNLSWYKKMLLCFCLDNFTRSISTLVRKRPNNMRQFLLATYACSALHTSFKTGEVEVLLLFVKHSPFNWPDSMYAYMLTFEYTVATILIFGILPIFLYKCHISDPSVLMLCCLSKTLGYTLLVFADKTWMIFVSVFFIANFGMIVACLRSILSKIVDDDEAGRCFALTAAFDSISELFGSIVYTRLYLIDPSLPFTIIAIMHFIILLFGLYIHYGVVELKGDDKNKAISPHYSQVNTSDTVAETADSEVEIKEKESDL